MHRDRSKTVTTRDPDKDKLLDGFLTILAITQHEDFDCTAFISQADIFEASLISALQDSISGDMLSENISFLLEISGLHEITIEKYLFCIENHRNEIERKLSKKEEEENFAYGEGAEDGEVTKLKKTSYYLASLEAGLTTFLREKRFIETLSEVPYESLPIAITLNELLKEKEAILSDAKVSIDTYSQQVQIFSRFCKKLVEKISSIMDDYILDQMPGEPFAENIRHFIEATLKLCTLDTIYASSSLTTIQQILQHPVIQKKDDYSKISDEEIEEFLKFSQLIKIVHNSIGVKELEEALDSAIRTMDPKDPLRPLFSNLSYCFIDEKSGWFLFLKIKELIDKIPKNLIKILETIHKIKEFEEKHQIKASEEGMIYYPRSVLAIEEMVKNKDIPKEIKERAVQVRDKIWLLIYFTKGSMLAFKYHNSDYATWCSAPVIRSTNNSQIEHYYTEAVPPENSDAHKLWEKFIETKSKSSKEEAGGLSSSHMPLGIFSSSSITREETENLARHIFTRVTLIENHFFNGKAKSGGALINPEDEYFLQLEREILRAAYNLIYHYAIHKRWKTDATVQNYLKATPVFKRPMG